MSTYYVLQARWRRGFETRKWYELGTASRASSFQPKDIPTDATDRAYRIVKRTESDIVVWPNKCKKRFSLCLDCNIHNDCERYSEHLKGKI